jgi:hypothetical protein
VHPRILTSHVTFACLRELIPSTTDQISGCARWIAGIARCKPCHARLNDRNARRNSPGARRNANGATLEFFQRATESSRRALELFPRRLLAFLLTHPATQRARKFIHLTPQESQLDWTVVDRYYRASFSPKPPETKPKP